ncbi:glycosyltransferase like 2 family protein [Clostridium sporogenes]|uniref:glycosyltransferase family 2 protein n=1 Tax=Clostridium TaxID=1485 RepID=UPI00090A59A5|nr:MULTISPECIES: glycosyltransferase family A protein [Clostridium]APF27343.1 glycosyltransferase like 2 family protein [Clostridium sporogenes]EKS4342894.1 glycosyltransferase family 2 protein [Clostridium botulinum]EKS4393358.1 glycosyltransferase family 2 protein [Clostridium botulinum]MDI6919493.1 glycosyltransferase family A protein [Clostridium botulinum]WMU96743.1 glycosyltransferase family A protein [Clostridium botulinum]
MNKTSVSVIIPYYNSERTIVRALNSVINQVYKNFEIILIDDGSNDNSYSVVEDFIKNNSQYQIKNLYQNNSGPSKARNLGIKQSIGKYIAFLDSDDSWDKNKLKIQMDFIESRQDIFILGCDHKIVEDSGIIIKSKNLYKFREVNFYLRLFKNYFSTPSVIIKKSALLEIGGFNEDQKYAEDTLLYLKILRKYKGGKIQLPLVNLYKNEFGQGGLSRNLIETEKCELKNFKELRSENYKYNKKINIILYFVIVTFSLIKYLRRILIIKLRRQR